MRKVWLLISLTILSIIIASASLTQYHLSGTNPNPSKPWMFIGAYATYEGHVNAALCNLSAVMQVTDLNATHVLIRTNSTIATSFLPTVTDSVMLWVNSTNINFQPKGETLSKTDTAQIAVKSIGVRNCTVYEYVNEAINVTYYVDDVFDWPVRMAYTTPFDSQLYTLEFNLKDTNISGLSSL